MSVGLPFASVVLVGLDVSGVPDEASGVLFGVEVSGVLVGDVPPSGWLLDILESGVCDATLAGPIAPTQAHATVAASAGRAMRVALRANAGQMRRAISKAVKFPLVFRFDDNFICYSATDLSDSEENVDSPQTLALDACSDRDNGARH